MSILKLKRKTKYRAIKTVVDGITFSSKKEAQRYRELLILQQAGEIESLQLQPVFELQEAFVHSGRKQQAIKYVADFSYRDRKSFSMIVEDVKGIKTDVYRMKKKMFLKKWGSMYELKEI